MAQVLLAGYDWKFRALLRAQLLEEGAEVEAFETVRGALETLSNSQHERRLLLADLTSSDRPAQEVAQLAPWAPKFPVWILIRHGELPENELMSCGFERILYLPVDMGALVRDIVQRVQKM